MNLKCLARCIQYFPYLRTTDVIYIYLFTCTVAAGGDKYL